MNNTGKLLSRIDNALTSLTAPGPTGSSGIFHVGMAVSLAVGMLLVFGSTMPLPPRTVDLAPGQKMVQGYLLHEGLGQEIQTRPMRPGEQAEEYILTYSRPDQTKPRVVVTIREHDLLNGAPFAER